MGTFFSFPLRYYFVSRSLLCWFLLLAVPAFGQGFGGGLDGDGNAQCQQDGDCNDSLFCNGFEQCSSGHCVTSGFPCAGNQTCDEATDECHESEGIIYYVATNGLDSNPGTIDQPFRTIKKAAGLVMAGDTIVIRGGLYVESYVRFAHSGLPDAPITVEGYPGETVQLTANSGSQWFFDFTDDYDAGVCDNGYYVFRGLIGFGSRHIWRFACGGRVFSDGSFPSKPHHVVIEDVEGYGCSSVISARQGGVEDIVIRRCDFHHCTGTEGNLDFSNNMDAVDVPQSGSHNILIEDTDFHEGVHHKINGIVTQGSVWGDVILRRCRSWNNGNYGFAMKSSGRVQLIDCEAWGNGSSQFYVRGMVPGDPWQRTIGGMAQHDLINCVAIGPRDSGGGTVVFRENTDVRIFNSTIVSLRDSTQTTNGWPLALSSPSQSECGNPTTLEIRNSAIATWDGELWWWVSSCADLRTLVADHNLFFKFGGGSTAFRKGSKKYSTLQQWRDATGQDLNSVWIDPNFAHRVDTIDEVPFSLEWPEDYTEIFDPHFLTDSPAEGIGANLGHMEIADLLRDKDGRSRPETGDWTVGAYELTAEADCIKGDMNHDQWVNGSDIDGFVEALMNQIFSCEADVNGDGSVDGFDIDAFVALLEP